MLDATHVRNPNTYSFFLTTLGHRKRRITSKYPGQSLPHKHSSTIQKIPWRINRRPDIQVHIHPTLYRRCRHRRLIPPIKINNIARHRPIIPLHEPIVPIKRRVIKKEILIKPRLGTQVIRTSHEAYQSGCGAIVQFAFPMAHFTPGAFIDGIVDTDNGRHVGFRCGVSFSFDGVVKLLFRGVDPVGGGGWLMMRCGGGGGGGGSGGGVVVVSWDGGDDAMG